MFVRYLFYISILIFTLTTNAHALVCYGSESADNSDDRIVVAIYETKQSRNSYNTPVIKLCFVTEEWNTERGKTTLARYVFAASNGDMPLDFVMVGIFEEQLQFGTHTIGNVYLSWERCLPGGGLKTCS